MPFAGDQSILRKWVRLARWRGWLTSKLPFVGAAALLLNGQDLSMLMTLAILVTVSAWAAFGFAVNAISDRECDYRAGKRNPSAGLSSTFVTFFLFVNCALTLGLSFVWAKGPAAPSIVLIGLILAAAYSLPPVRIKERGFSGLVGGAAAQWCFPVLAVSAATPTGLKHIDTWCMALLSAAIGIRSMGIHQLYDVFNDRKAGVRTYAATGGAVGRVVYGAFVSETISLALTLIFAWPRSAAATAALALWISYELILGPFSDSFQKRLLSYRQAPLAEYYYLLLPLALAIDRARDSRSFIIVAAVFAVICRAYARHMAYRCSNAIVGRRHPA